MQNLLFQGNPLTNPGQEDRYTNYFKIKYNQEYCVYSGNHYIPSINYYSSTARSNASYHYIQAFLQRLENLSIGNIVGSHQICNQYLLELSSTFVNSNIPVSDKDAIINRRILDVINTYLTPCEDLKLRKGPITRRALVDLNINDFLNLKISHIASRAGNFYWGGGIFGAAQMWRNSQYYYAGIFNPLAILAIKTEAVQLPRLAGLINSVSSDCHFLENREDLFKLYVQAGFDYKDFPSQSFRKVYKNILLPFAKENNIEVVTVPNLKEKFFYTIDLPTFNNAIEKAREENVVMNKVINSYLSNLVPEPEPTEEPFDVLW